jgi:3-dehydroquinate synthase
MEKLDIKLKERSYPIYITGSYDNLGECIYSAGIRGKIAIITDSNVDALQSQYCVDSLDGYDWEIHKHVMAPGEENKTLDTIREIYGYLKYLKFERSSTIIALGGGVVGDVAGFAAATFLRGINFIQVPTTLLAQADSSVGGKVAVDFEGSKNIIGSFYQPKLVYINVNSLRTLPKRQILSGLAEVIKHGLILNKDFFDYIDNNSEKILSLDSEVMEHITSSNCIIKGGVVEKDEKETGLRVILNFGHTIGHAVESQLNFKLLHGECVSIGMVGAFKLAHRMGMVDKDQVSKVSGLLERLGLPIKVSGADVESLYNQMFYDKKVRDGKLLFILPRNIGQVEQLIISDEVMVKEVLAELIE